MQKNPSTVHFFRIYLSYVHFCEVNTAGRQMGCSRLPGFGFCPVVSVLFMALVPVSSVFSEWGRQLFSCQLQCRNDIWMTLLITSVVDYCHIPFLVLLTFSVHILESEQVLVIVISELSMKKMGTRDTCTHSPQVCHISSVYWLWAHELWQWHWSIFTSPSNFSEIELFCHLHHSLCL